MLVNALLFMRRGCATMSETGLDGLKERLLTHVGPNKFIQLENTLAQYNTATRYFKDEMPFFIVRRARSEI